MAAALKLTAARSKAICAAVRCGASRAVAAEAAGVSKSSLQNWLVKGEAANASATYKTFAEDLRAAEAGREVEALQNICRAAGEDWRADAWWLQHGPARERYARVDHHQISGPDGEPLDLDGGWDLSALSDRELAALQRIAEKAQRDG